MNFSYLFLTFIIYSFVGYICEVIYCSMLQKEVVNRGFLCGPICPIYGFGAVVITLLLKQFKSDPVIVFILGVILTSSLEYITSFCLEKIFHNKWWDYSFEKFNINGRVCLRNSLMFGFGSLVVIYLSYPIIDKFLNNFKNITLLVFTLIILIIFILDCLYSFVIAYNLRNRIIICEELKNEKLAKIPGMLEKLIKERVSRYKTYPKRLLKAFPNLKKDNYKELELMKKIKEKNHKKKKRK